MNLKILIITDLAIFLFMLFIAPLIGGQAYNILKNHHTSPLFGLFLLFIFVVDWHAQTCKLKILRHQHPKTPPNDSNARISFFFVVWCCRMLFEFVLLSLALNALVLHFYPKTSAWYTVPLAVASILSLIKVSHLVFVETAPKEEVHTHSNNYLIIHFLNIACTLTIISTVLGSIMPAPVLSLNEWEFINWNYFSRKPMELFWYAVMIGMMYLPLRWIDVIEGDMIAKNLWGRIQSLIKFIIEGAIVLSPMLRFYLKE